MPASRRELAKQPRPLGFQSAQLLVMRHGEAFQDGVTARCQNQKNTPAVGAAGHPAHVTFGDQTVGQANRAVGEDLQPFRQFTQENPFAARKTFDGQQGLVVLGRNARLAGRPLAEAEKLTKRPTELGEPLIIGFG